MNILSLYENNKIDKDEMLILYVLKENNLCDITKLIYLFKDSNMLKEKVETLYLKKLLNIDWDKNILEYIENDSQENNNITNVDNEIQKIPVKKSITIDEIDKLRVILNRELMPFELEKLKKWYKDYDMNTIVEAVYKSALKNIDNFNYIEKVLQNQDTGFNLKVSEKKEKKLKKNFDFFS